MGEIGAEKKEKIMVFNKMDLAHDDIIPVRGCDNVRFREMRTNIDVPIKQDRVEDIRRLYALAVFRSV